MENDAARSEPGGVAEPSGESSAEKLRKLEEEIARLKGQIGPEGNQQEPGSLPEDSETEGAELGPSEQAEVEALVKQAKLAKIRKQGTIATKLLKEAADRAPRSVIVLEALADDQMERRIYNGAAQTYAKALKLDPSNVALERKHADAIYYTYAAGVGMELAEDSFSTPKARLLLAIFLPGIGQMARGAWAKGTIILGGFVLSLIVTGVIKSESGKNVSSENRYMFVAPLALAVAFWLWGLLDASMGAKEAAPRRIEHPKPPVDLPFD